MKLSNNNNDDIWIGVYAMFPQEFLWECLDISNLYIKHESTYPFILLKQSKVSSILKNTCILLSLRMNFKDRVVYYFQFSLIAVFIYKVLYRGYYN